MTYLYQRIATDLGQAIDKRVYVPGARLPSLREVKKQYGVSMATAIEAFARLEALGLIESRPKSGYFVRPQTDRLKQPKKRRPNPRPGKVEIAELAMEVIDVSARSEFPLGLSAPGTEMLPVDAITRCQSRAPRMQRSAMSRYETAKGSTVLRRAISRLMTDSGCIVDPSQIVITNGAQEALFLALRSVTMPGDIVAVESPTYFGVLQAIEVLNLRIVELPTDPTTGVDIDALEKIATSKRIKACVLAPTIQNPMGFSMRDSDKERAVAILNDNCVPLIEDDVYGHLSNQSPRPVAAKAFDHKDDAIFCSSFSKTVSPGIRVGWLAPGKHMTAVLRNKFLLNLSSATASQQAMAEFLEGNRFRRATNSASIAYARRLQLMRSAVFDYFPDGTTCTAPAGGFNLWIELPGKFDSMEILRRSIKDGISLSPGRLFSRGNAYRNCMRLSCGATAENQLHDCVKRLARHIH